MHIGRCIKNPIYWNQLQTTAIKDKKFTSSGVARPRPTRACALPSAISFESCDSTMDPTKINCSANNHKSVTNINASAWKPSTISQERARGVIWSAR